MYDFLTKKKKDLYDLGAIWVLGNTGEKYLHIPMVP
jgi:hypothetical protein